MGKGTRSWKQRAINEKEILKDNLTYADWHTALSSVRAIYLIVDRTDGKQYVGSAYGEDGLLQRWSMYINTKHGYNKKMKELICNYPERYHNFQFCRFVQILWQKSRLFIWKTCIRRS